jgi:hypothetical protein
MNRKIRIKEGPWGQKLNFTTKNNIVLGKEQLKKQITDNRSSLEHKKNKKNEDNLIS